MNLKHKVSFSLRPYGKNHDIFQIRLRVTFNCQRVEHATGCQINDPRFWDKEHQLVVSGYVGPKGETDITINNTLRNQRDQMEWTFKYFEVNDLPPTPSQVSDKYIERLRGTVPQRPAVRKKKEDVTRKGLDLFAVFDRFVSESREKNAWSLATVKKIATLRNDLSAFKKNLGFSDLTENTLTRFVAYLRDDKKLRTPRKKKGEREEYDEEDVTGLKNSTIEKKLENGVLNVKILECDGAVIPQNMYTKTFDYDKIEDTLKLRTRLPGDFIVINPDGRRKSFSDYLTDMKVDKELRDKIPLVARGKEILWAIGMRSGESCRVDEKTQRSLVMTFTNDNLEEQDDRQH